jgi:hypothetical protein
MSRWQKEKVGSGPRLGKQGLVSLSSLAFLLAASPLHLSANQNAQSPAEAPPPHAQPRNRLPTICSSW